MARPSPPVPRSPLADLEAAAAAPAGGRVEALLRALGEIAALGHHFLASGGPDIAPRAAATRTAAAIGAVLADRSVPLELSQVRRFWPLRTIVQYMFGASEFGSADHLLRILGPAPAGRGQPDFIELSRRLLLASLDSEIDFDPLRILDLPPEDRQLAYASLISSDFVVTERGEARRQALLDRADEVEPAPLPPDLATLVMMANAWFLCSYGSSSGKHRIKPVLNRTFRLHLASLGLADRAQPAVRTRPIRPTLVVAAEVMKSTHVQYRYFGQYLRQLSNRFRLVLVTEESQVDAPVADLFDEVLIFRRKRDGGHLHGIAALIKGCTPDILFWLSVGMAEWGPPLATLRLAPIQLVGLGHSASTFSPAIDYFLLEEGYVSEPRLFSETLILLPDSSLRFERSPHFKPAPVRIREVAEPLRVAVPANVAKLNACFLRVLERIAARTKRSLEFHFLPSARPLAFEALRPRLLCRFPAAKVHPALSHNLYRGVLSACDLTLSPFPFGGLHSVVDSLEQGLPVVAMAGTEPHGRTDAMLLRRLGMPEWLIASDPVAYEEAALRLIEEDVLRVELSRRAACLDIENLLFGDGSTPLAADVEAAVWWLYENHEAILSSGRRTWTAADRAAFGAPDRPYPPETSET